MMSLNRRAVLTSGTAFAMLPTTGIAQSAFSEPAMANRLADLAGFDTLPRDLLNGLRRALDAENLLPKGWRDGDPLPDDMQKRILRGLYTGVFPSDDDQRIGFANALMWGAVEDSNNVISYCGGLPGYWAKPPTAS